MFTLLVLAGFFASVLSVPTPDVSPVAVREKRSECSDQCENDAYIMSSSIRYGICIASCYISGHGRSLETPLDKIASVSHPITDFNIKKVPEILFDQDQTTLVKQSRAWDCNNCVKYTHPAFFFCIRDCKSRSLEEPLEKFPAVPYPVTDYDYKIAPVVPTETVPAKESFNQLCYDTCKSTYGSGYNFTLCLIGCSIGGQKFDYSSDKSANFDYKRVPFVPFFPTFTPEVTDKKPVIPVTPYVQEKVAAARAIPLCLLDGKCGDKLKLLKH